MRTVARRDDVFALRAVHVFAESAGVTPQLRQTIREKIAQWYAGHEQTDQANQTQTLEE